jgi:hypothetical protein
VLLLMQQQQLLLPAIEKRIRTLCQVDIGDFDPQAGVVRHLKSRRYSPEREEAETTSDREGTNNNILARQVRGSERKGRGATAITRGHHAELSAGVRPRNGMYRRK